MDWLHALLKHDDKPDYDKIIGTSSPRATVVQIILSASLGLLAFLAFCILRPRWTSLYAARKKQKDAATILPELPSSMFGWMPVLWRITDQQVLASAGIDAYVFLNFFKMAAQFLFVTLFFSLVVIKPVHDAYPDDTDVGNGNRTSNGTHNDTRHSMDLRHLPVSLLEKNSTNPFPSLPEYFETDYLWMYVVFAYLFSGLAVWLLVSHTRKVIQVRQEYLGTQSTITDRTIRLSGIPKHLRDEKQIKNFIEELDIGKVESVTLCRHWKELDVAMKERMTVLRRLELAYTIYAGQQSVERNTETLPIVQPVPNGRLIDVDDEEQGSEEGDQLLVNGNGVSTAVHRPRPQVTLRIGRLRLESRKVDAIDYYSERLRSLDERINELRKSRFEATPLAFVTMDSVAAAQMAVQAVLDPSPLQLIAACSPPPTEVLWSNTYQTRSKRMVKSWIITVLIVIFTIFWSALLVPIAGLLTTEAIGKVFPQLAHLLKEHKNIEILVNAQLPVLFSTLLVVLVPYLYYYLSWTQGFISVGEIELSAISKNFFFVFFNFFLVFTVLGTASEFLKYLQEFGNPQGFHNIAFTLAASLQRHLRFYCNYIILQSLTLHPLRLLELGSVAMYPIYLIGAKTPRDYAELVQPPFFSYGFYLPGALLIFIICMVYCVFRHSWTVLLAGFSYFLFGHFVYKYQLLYAMDHSPHSTGRAWGMICDRIFVGMVFFQITIAGQLILKNAIPRTITMVPLIIATLWFSIVFGRTYKPLLRFIALQNIKKAQQEDYTSPDDPLPGSMAEAEHNVWADPDVDRWRFYRESRSASPSNGELLRFVNLNLVSPLRGVWLANKDFGMPEHQHNGAQPETV